jgi:hypothetical protein
MDGTSKLSTTINKISINRTTAAKMAVNTRNEICDNLKRNLIQTLTPITAPMIKGIKKRISVNTRNITSSPVPVSTDIHAAKNRGRVVFHRSGDREGEGPKTTCAGKVVNSEYGRILKSVLTIGFART